MGLFPWVNLKEFYKDRSILLKVGGGTDLHR